MKPIHSSTVEYWATLATDAGGRGENKMSRILRHLESKASVRHQASPFAFAGWRNGDGASSARPSFKPLGVSVLVASASVSIGPGQEMVPVVDNEAV
ncbi:gamma-glutamyl phosphate reductase [Anopheles sinensis]|uniref:Gamma-glutamyl phosphate reductase n=1 Tax=Anopheles sinensis TaxID=74873 RepID=A0A084VSG6_ANOSI|nr:gamma-glutamyl phosphate reductase [Anopheles sinensis]